MFVVQAQLEEKEATIANLKSKLERNTNEGDNALRWYSSSMYFWQAALFLCRLFDRSSTHRKGHVMLCHTYGSS